MTQKNNYYLVYVKSIINYCRKCQKLICSHCKNSNEYKTHKTISVNTNNLNESAKLYVLTLKKEINSKYQKDMIINFNHLNLLKHSLGEKLF